MAALLALLARGRPACRDAGACRAELGPFALTAQVNDDESQTERVEQRLRELPAEDGRPLAIRGTAG